PVVVTNVVGITETVVDLSAQAESMTAILVPSEIVAKLAQFFVSVMTIMQLFQLGQRGKRDDAGISRKILVESMARMVAKNRNLGSKIRENCRNRVAEKFRWTNAGQMALNRYSAARSMALKTLQK